MAQNEPTEFWRFQPNAPASGHVLSRADEISEHSAREFVIGRGRSAFRMFVVRRDGDFFGYLNVCPHYSLPLNHQPNQFLRQGHIECAQHYARFNVEDGLCFAGACEGESLTPIKVAVDAEGFLVIA
jgi:nitrite reductase/ring-hydroxylating ferredoxin subunit